MRSPRVAHRSGPGTSRVGTFLTRLALIQICLLAALRHSWIPSGDTTNERYLLPGRCFMNGLSVTFCSQVNLLGAAPTKAAALITFLPLAAAALLVTGTFGLALSSGSWGTGAATAA